MAPEYLRQWLIGGIDPREANIKFFKQAKYGLFLHYGLFSLMGKHEWVQLRSKIPVAEYAKLKDSFTAEKFDAAHIVKSAKSWGMKYINIVTRHHDSFCLWDTNETDFKSTNSPCGRDLIKELYDACEEGGMALFLYYSHGRDWKHPHAPNNDEYGGSARPEYDPPEPTYAYGADHDLNVYVDFMKRQVTELLTRFPHAAGIWLDGIAVPMNGDTKAFKVQELYDLIHNLSPHALVSYKQGLLGTEDFFAPEHGIPTSEKGADAKKVGQISSRRETPIEICTTMIKEPVSWGYYEGGIHKNEAEVWESLVKAGESCYNLLLNIGPLPSGELDPEDAQVLSAVGEKIDREGLPSLLL
jgi:alpha-L-fucosidase